MRILVRVVWLWFAVAMVLAAFFLLPTQLARAFGGDPEAVGGLLADVLVVGSLLLTRRKVWSSPST